MKRILAFTMLLVITLSLILSSCGGGDATTADSSTTAGTSDESTTTVITTTVTEVTTTTEITTTAPPVNPPPAENLNERVEGMLQSKHKLTFDENGSFKILILADIHMNFEADASKVQAAKDRIKLLVDREDPDLVIFTGDNTLYSSTEEKLRANIDAIAGYIEEKQIPWCHVYGNHDHEHALSKNDQQAIYMSYEYCISKENAANVDGIGNYVHAVYNADGSIGAVLYLLDSGTYMSSGGYDYIKYDQIQWYKNTSKDIEDYAGGRKIPSIMAFHIPLKENTYAYESRDDKTLVSEYTGERNENICSSTIDTNLFETVLERGDVKAIVTGHDHINDYMYNYKGVMLASSPNFTELTYNSASVHGARVLEIKPAEEKPITTYVSYIEERLNPDDYEALDKDAALEYTSKEIDEAVIMGWNCGSLAGNAEISLEDGKGVSGSEAIKLTRDDIGNFEVSFKITNMGKLGDNKYLVIWADFTGVEFRKACFGLLSDKGYGGPYRTDDADYLSPLYYLADGSDEWVTLSHGGDGCFGVGDGGSQGMMGKKGYFAIPVENLKSGSIALTEDTLISGFYFYGSLNSGSCYNVPFYFDDIKLVEDYKNING